MLQYMLDYIISILILFEKQENKIHIKMSSVDYEILTSNQYQFSCSTLIAYLNTNEHIRIFKKIGIDNFPTVTKQEHITTRQWDISIYIYAQKS